MARVSCFVAFGTGLCLLFSGSRIASGQDEIRVKTHSALLEVVRRVPISTEVAGRIVTVTPSDEGVTVKAGAEMIRLDDAVIQAEVHRAKVELDLQTEIEFARVSLDVATAEQQQKRETNQRRPGAFNPSEIRQVELEVKKGEASLRKAIDDKQIQDAELKIKQAQLAQYTVKAPFDGLVTLVKVFPGQNVRPGEQVLELTDMSMLRAQVKVPARDRQLLFVGDKVEIRPGRIRAGVQQRTNAARPVRGSGLFDDETKEEKAAQSTPDTSAPVEAPAEFTGADVVPDESDDSVFLGEIRFIDPVQDNISGEPMIKLSVFVPNRQDKYGRYLLHQGMPVTATVLSRPRD
jgi:multidrug efflux pump subunit AcrA (membrane-fusion protein)